MLHILAHHMRILRLMIVWIKRGTSLLRMITVFAQYKLLFHELCSLFANCLHVTCISISNEHCLLNSHLLHCKLYNQEKYFCIFFCDIVKEYIFS